MKSKKKKKNLFQKIFDFRYFLYDFVKITAAIPTLIYLRLKIKYLNGRRPKGIYSGSYIIASNHQSYTDVIALLVVFWQRRVSFIATRDLFSTKLRRFFFNNVRMIPIDKNNIKMETFKKAKDVIDSGHLVLIFPEGHVTNSEEVENYKSGVVMLSIMTKAPVLQVYVQKREKWWHRQRVVIGEKIDLEQYFENKIPTMEDIIRATNILREKEEQLAEVLKNKK